MADLTITADRLVRFVKWLKVERAKEIAPYLEISRQSSLCTTPRRVRYYMANLAHESQGFTKLVESFAYRDPDHLDDTFSAIHGRDDALSLMRLGPDAIANRVYANRFGNGNEASGDGARYKGRGWIQTTFKDNYAQTAKMTGLQLVDQPGLLARPNEASQAASAYWRWKGIGRFADAGDFESAVRAINPALAGFSERQMWLKKALVLWPN